MRRVLLAIVFILLLPALGNAQTFPAFTQTDTYSNIGWSVTTTRGWSFTVSSRIVVDQLGFWDSGQNGLANAHGVGLWRGDGTLLTSTTVPAGNTAPLEGTFRWSPTTIAVELQPGTTYVVGAYWSSGSSDTTLAGGESVVFDSRVSLIEGRAINTIGLTYPALTTSVDLTANFKARPQNQPPVANAGPDRNAYTNFAITLQASAYDPDGEPIIGWYWAVDQAACGDCWLLFDNLTPTPTFKASIPGEYVLVLGVESPTGGSAPDFTTVRVRDNIPPVAVATADRTTIRVGETVCFDGSQSSDPEGGPLSYYWNYGDGSPEQGGASACHAFQAVGTFDVTLTAVDERNAFDIDIVEITVLAPAVLIDLGDRTRDEVTGLDWLDLTQTQNLSYDQIVGGAGGWTTDGWRHATLDEVCQLFTRYAMAPASPCGAGSVSQPGDAVRSLEALLGITRILGGQQEDTFGFVDNGTAGPTVGRGRLTYNLGGSSSFAGVEAQSLFGRSDALPTHGNFLVRPYATEVPSMHPIGIYGLLSGLLVGVGLIAMRRRAGGA